jgi:hypothetical protein
VHHNSLFFLPCPTGAVGWMKNKNQNPYSFETAKPSTPDFLSDEEKMMVEKKVFVERRYQTSRKIKPNSERTNPSQLKRPALTVNALPIPAQISVTMPFSVLPVETDVKPTLTFPSAAAEYSEMSSVSTSCELVVPLSIIKREKDDEPMESEEEDQFLKSAKASTKDMDGLPPKIAKLSTK